MSEFLAIMSDPAHILSELVWEVVFLLLGILIARRGIQKEHRLLDDEHGYDHNDWFFEKFEPRADAPGLKSNGRQPTNRGETVDREH